MSSTSISSIHVQNFSKEEMALGRNSLAHREKLRNQPLKLQEVGQKILKELYGDKSIQTTSWNNARQILAKTLALPNEAFAKRQELWEKFITELKPDYIEDLLATLTDLADFKMQKQCLKRIPNAAFFNALGKLKKNLNDKIELMAKSAHYYEKMQKQEALITRQATKPVRPRTIDNLLLAFSYFSTQQEPDNPWQALQILQMYGAFLIAPFFLSSSVDNLFKDTLDIGQMNVFFLTMFMMVSVYMSLNVYQKHFQPIPMIVKPMRNYTQEAAEGRFDPLLARDEIIEQVFRCLAGSNRETRQHPLLVGPPGVGKTGILIEIARRIAIGEVPASLKKILKGMQVFGGSSALLLPSSAMGEGDEKIERFLKRLDPHKNQIALFLDEIHALFKEERFAEITNTILDTGVRGFPYVIGATTPEEYNTYITNNPARARRLSVIYVPPTNEAETALILRGMIRRHHLDMPISEDVLKKTYQYTTSKLKKYSQPDISKRILSNAISQIRLEQQSLPASSKLQQKYVERDNLLLQAMSVVDNPQAEETLITSLQAIELEIKNLEKIYERELNNKEQFTDILKQQNKVQEQLLKLAVKISDLTKKEQACDHLKKYFAFLLHFQRSHLQLKRSQLEKSMHLSTLNPAFIEGIVDKFIENEAKAKEVGEGQEKPMMNAL